MQRFFIIAANCALLATVLLGVQEVTGAQLWHWQISSLPAAHALRFWALALAAAGNAAGALFLVKGRKERKMCWLWAGVFAALASGAYAYERGWFNFIWIKRALLWLTNKF